MEISENTIDSLEKIICGNPVYRDKQLSPYRTGAALVAFFNQFGFDDEYESGFPARWQYTKDKIRSLNSSNKIVSVIEAAVDPRHFLGKPYEVEKAVEYINQFMKFDGFELRMIGNFYKVCEIKKDLVEVSNPFTTIGLPNHQYLLEQIDKCDTKISDNDYEGAITNARSMLEAVLLDLEELIVGERQKYDGNLNQLFTRVRNLLNLDPSRPDITNSLRQLLSGLISVVNGISSLRNKMSDAHARTYKAEKHHAQLAVNSSRTIVDFIFETFEYQLKKGLIELSMPDNDN